MAQVNSLDVKQKNRNDIFKIICKNNCVSKQQIMRELDLSLPTVLQNLKDMIEEGYVFENGSIGHTGGRRAKGYSIVPNSKIAIGVDINMTHYSVVAIDLSGQVLFLKHVHFRFEKTDAYFARVSDLVDECIRSLELKESQMLPIGIAVQGVLSVECDRFTYAPIPGLTNESTEMIQRHFHYPSHVKHDSNAAAYAEQWYHPDLSNFVYVSLSTNLGGTLIVDHQKYPGDMNFAGNIEHLTLVPDGKKCYCGKLGCAECYCSTQSLTSSVPSGLLSDFFYELQNGSSEQVQVWKEYVKFLSIFLNSLHTIMDCEIVIGGYLAEYLAPYLDEIKSATYARCYYPGVKDFLRLAKCTSEPIAIGVALNCIRTFIDTF